MRIEGTNFVIPQVFKFCPKCKIQKDYNCDFYLKFDNKDYKYEWCKKCWDGYRKKFKYKKRLTTKMRINRRRYIREYKSRLYGSRIPIADYEIRDMCIWLQHPQAWMHDSKTRTKEIDAGLRSWLKNVKKYSQWVPNHGKMHLYDEVLMWIKDVNVSFDGLSNVMKRRCRRVLRRYYCMMQYNSMWRPNLRNRV